MKVSIGKAPKEMGVAIETLRRWEAAGKIEVERTPDGHRCYDLATLRVKDIRPRVASLARATLGYARVSSHD
jgi:putative resolvase